MKLTSYSVDRGISGSWHPFQGNAVYYVEQLGERFAEILPDEIESALAWLEGSTAGGAMVPKSTVDLLAELRAGLQRQSG